MVRVVVPREWTTEKVTLKEKLTTLSVYPPPQWREVFHSAALDVPIYSANAHAREKRMMGKQEDDKMTSP